MNPFDLAEAGMRPLRESAFVVEKAVEAILYIVSKLGGATIHEVLKAQYAADKHHLSKYAFSGSGDDYVAMEYGPVASNSYNLLKAARGDWSEFINRTFYDVCDGALAVKNRKEVVALREPNLDWLTSAYLASLDRGIEEVRGLGFKARTNNSHDLAWHKARERGQQNQEAAPDMKTIEIAETLPNGSDIVAVLREE